MAFFSTHRLLPHHMALVIYVVTQIKELGQLKTSESLEVFIPIPPFGQFASWIQLSAVVHVLIKDGTTQLEALT